MAQTNEPSHSSSTNALAIPLGDGVAIEMVWIPAGRFQMGSAAGDVDEQPVHEVPISKGFWMGKYEITQAQFQKIIGRNPSTFVAPDRPVESVAHKEIDEFMHRLLSAWVIPEDYWPRLPTEAEWEYACRAGSNQTFCFGDDESLLGDYAWYQANSGGQTHPAGQKKPNAFGLYDMHGNVWEWCEDWYGGDFYRIGKELTDPHGPTAGWAKVIRGGSWRNQADYCRSTNRFKYRPWVGDYSVGFRLVLWPR